MPKPCVGYVINYGYLCVVCRNVSVSADDVDMTEDHSDDTAASDWLRDLGIDHSRYRSLDPSKIREYPFLLSMSRTGAEMWIVSVLNIAG